MNEFWRAGFTISSWNVIGQALVLAASPVLTRLYEPDEFGTFGILLGLSAVIAMLANGRLDMAIAIPKSAQSAEALAVASVFMTLAFLLLAIPAFTVAGRWTADSKYSEVGALLPLVPVTASLVAGNLCVTQLLLRYRRYKSIALRNLVFGPLVVLFQVMFYLVPTTQSMGLYLGYSSAYFVVLVLLLNGYRRARGRKPYRFRPRLVGAAWLRFRRFPEVLAPAGLFNAVGSHLPVLLVGGIFGVTTAGYLTLMQRVVTVPLSLVGTAISQVFVSELKGGLSTESRSLFRQITRVLLAASMPLLAALSLAPEWFPLVFGGNWRTSGAFALALAPAIVAQFVVGPLSAVLVIGERLKLQFGWDVGRVVVILLTILFSYRSGLGPSECLVLTGGALSILYVLNWHLCDTALARPAGRVAR